MIDEQDFKMMYGYDKVREEVVDKNENVIIMEDEIYESEIIDDFVDNLLLNILVRTCKTMEMEMGQYLK
jgi:hypothetical protein